MEGKQKRRPESDALLFYYMNHAYGLLQQKYGLHRPMDEFDHAAAKIYFEAVSDMSVAMFGYLCMITMRESRHAYKDSRLEDLYSKYPSHFETWHKKIQDGTKSWEIFIDHPINMDLGSMVDFIYECFDTCGFDSSFGGVKWREVTHCLKRFVDGETSMEVMLDTSFTLAHNTGPIFNKGYYYLTQDNEKLMMILDCQRAGQIPQLVWSGIFDQHISPTMVEAFDSVSYLIVEQVEYVDVDWQKVMDLGAVGSYKGLVKPMVAPAEVEDTDEIPY
jgi:hypothetical protein